MTRANLRGLPAYEIGREDERSGFVNLTPFDADARDAYLLGRMEERNDQVISLRKQVAS